MVTAVLSLLAQAAVGAAPTTPANDTRSPNEIVAAAPASEWAAIAPRDLLVMDLAPDRDGKPRRVVIQLLPPPFSQGWIGNIRTLAAARWWDGTSVNRVQDNYVVQWGDGDAEEKARAKSLPVGLSPPDGREYTARLPEADIVRAARVARAAAMRDAYADLAFLRHGWPLAAATDHTEPFVVDTKTGHALTRPLPAPLDRLRVSGPGTMPAWPVHCYGTVGVGRDLPPDTGTGAELYAVIGQAPRQLDRNIAVVGRVIEGIEHLSSLPRGTGDLGFYKTVAERVPIVSVRIGDRVPGLPRYEYLSTESASFARYADARANRRDPFFIVPAGGADICNVPVPVRRVRG